MKNKNKRKICALVLAGAFTLCGWVLPACSQKKDDNLLGGGQPEWQEDQSTGTGAENIGAEVGAENGAQTGTQNGAGNAEGQTGNEPTPEEPAEEQTPPKTTPVSSKPQDTGVQYIKVNGTGVNIRSGAGSSYAVLGTAQKDTLYALAGKSGSWYKTHYKNQTAYISASLCTVVNMSGSANKAVEDVILQGCKCLGVKYVYGATRYHDGTGRRLSGFTTSAFDCSSLMQYIFKLGAGVNLQVNTRTQIYQGKTVKKSELKRGDLLFFTNASRKDNVGIERVGHVALYLGDNYILHTASDFAKIEQISSSRWGYYIQAQRIL